MKTNLFSWKQFLFKTYGWWMFLGILLLISLGLLNASRDIWGFVITSVGALLTSAYFIQKQKIEETQLFIDLFEKFNARYSLLSAALDNIVSKADSEDLSDQEKSTLTTYFNLCAEEYLMYDRGYVYPKVWQSWSRGMQQYFEHPRIAPFWQQEILSDSYYGIETQVR